MGGHADALPKFQVHTSGTLLHRSVGESFFWKETYLGCGWVRMHLQLGVSWIADNRAQVHLSGQTGTSERVCSADNARHQNLPRHDRDRSYFQFLALQLFMFNELSHIECD